MNVINTYRWSNVALGTLTVLVLLAARSFSVTPEGDGLVGPGGWRVPELCLTKRLTGQPCPTCNLGRSIVLAAHGDVARSRKLHRGGVLVAAWLALHTFLRGLGALCPPSGRFWWVDLALTGASLVAVAVAILLLSPIPGSSAL